jgi:hypothetical protein
MLIHSKSPHTDQSLRIAGAGPGLELDRVPGCMPVHAEVPGQRRHRRVIVGQGVGRPLYGAHGKDHSRRDDLMGLAEHPGRTVGLPAAPQPFQPPQHCDPAQTRRIVQHPGLAAVAGRDHPTRRAAGLDLIRFHCQYQPAAVIFVHIEHMHAGNIENRIGSGAPARTRATHRVGHRRVLRGKEAWMLLSPVKPDLLVGIKV